MDKVFDSWNKALAGYTTYQEHLQRLTESDSFARSITHAQESVKRALQNFQYPNLNIPSSTLQSILKAQEAVSKMGLESWVDEGNDQTEDDKASDDTPVDEELPKPPQENDTKDEGREKK